MDFPLPEEKFKSTAFEFVPFMMWSYSELLIFKLFFGQPLGPLQTELLLLEGFAYPLNCKMFTTSCKF